MGRPIKIQKFNASFNAAVDQKFPLYADMEAQALPGGTQLYPGLVGGTATASTSATAPIIAVNANILFADGTNTGVVACSVLRQKGVRKYLVANRTAYNVSSGLIVGQAYQIDTLGTTTDWAAIGAPVTFAVGDIFTATGVGSGDGTVLEIGTCELANTAAPTPGYMNIEFTNGGTTYYIAKLNGKYMLDYSGVRWEANFFDDAGSQIKSGTTGGPNVPGQQNILDFGIVDNFTS